MAKKQKAIIDFTHYQEEELEPVTTIITNKLTTNALTFPALLVPAATIVSQIGDYTVILGKPFYDGKTEELKAARLIVEDSISSNGGYVNQVAKGDPVILAKSGYPLTKIPQPVGPLSKTTLKVSSTDNAGEFEFDIEGVTKADGCIIAFTLASNPETNPHKWQWQWCPKTKGLIQLLLSSTRYKLVSVAVGSDPNLTFSDPIERTTQ